MRSSSQSGCSAARWLAIISRAEANSSLAIFRRSEILDGWHSDAQGTAHRQLFLDSRRNDNTAYQSREKVEKVELVEILKR